MFAGVVSMELNFQDLRRRSCERKPKPCGAEPQFDPWYPSLAVIILHRRLKRGIQNVGVLQGTQDLCSSRRPAAKYDGRVNEGNDRPVNGGTTRVVGQSKLTANSIMPRSNSVHVCRKNCLSSHNVDWQLQRSTHFVEAKNQPE